MTAVCSRATGASIAVILNCISIRLGMNNSCPVARLHCPSIVYCITFSGMSSPHSIRISICCCSGDVLDVISRFYLICYICDSTVIISTVTGNFLHAAVPSNRQRILIYRPLCIQCNVLCICPGPALTNPACPVRSGSICFLIPSHECISSSGESICFGHITCTVSRLIGCHGSGSTVGIISYSIFICSPYTIQIYFRGILIYPVITYSICDRIRSIGCVLIRTPSK